MLVGQRHGASTLALCSLKVPLRSHTRTVLSYELLRMRWPSGIAAADGVVGVLFAGAYRLLLATLHTLTSLSSEPLMMCWPSGVTAASRSWCAPPVGRASRRRGTGGARPRCQGRPQSALRRVAPRRRSRRCPPRSCARERRRASTASRCRHLSHRRRAPRAPPPRILAPGWCIRTRRRALDGLVVRAGDDAAVGDLPIYPLCVPVAPRPRREPRPDRCARRRSPPCTSAPPARRGTRARGAPRCAPPRPPAGR